MTPDGNDQESFGRGRFDEFGDPILDRLIEVFDRVLKREGLDPEVAEGIRAMRNDLEEMPAKAPEHALGLTLSNRINYEGYSGMRYYTLTLSPETFRLHGGGSEWSADVGSDSWSGPELYVEADGESHSSGDVDGLIQEMLEMAFNPEAEVDLEVF